MTNPTQHQVGGDHYTKLAIQPMQYSMANGLNALQGRRDDLLALPSRGEAQ